MEFLGLITRCQNEPYVTEFVNYYLSQGVDKIYIIDDNSNAEIYADVINNDKVIIRYDSNIIRKGSINQLYNDVKNEFEWIIYVDLDEFITAKKHMTHTIKYELETTFKDCACVKIPWVMMSCNSIERNPDSLLRTNIYRWNHDIKHVNMISSNRKFRCRYNQIEVKCIFKPRFFDNILDHHPISPKLSIDALSAGLTTERSQEGNCAALKIVESVRNTEQPLNPYYSNLRECDIKFGYLLCYHYRIYSIEHATNKMKHNVWYSRFTEKDILSNDYPEIIDETLMSRLP